MEDCGREVERGVALGRYAMIPEGMEDCHVAARGPCPDQVRTIILRCQVRQVFMMGWRYGGGRCVSGDFASDGAAEATASEAGMVEPSRFQAELNVGGERVQADRSTFRQIE